MIPDTPSSAASGMGADHERIWLEPMAPVYGCEGRQWCQDKVWPDCDGDPEPTEYIRADLHRHALSAKDRELAEARAEIESLKEENAGLQITDAQICSQAAAALDRATTAERARDEALSALREIATFDCGCKPCTGQCRKGEAAEIELEARVAIARSVITPVSREQRGEEA